MWRPNCKTKACELCQEKIPWQDTWQAPRYMRWTAATRSRNAESREARRYSSSKNSPRKENRTRDSATQTPATGASTEPATSDSTQRRTTFFDLPLEIRRLIYRFCLKPNSLNIRADIEGGNDFHKDAPKSNTKLRLKARLRPSVPLLRTNKQICAEATEESYRQIPLRLLDLNMWDIRDDRANYWLREHPFRFTQEIILQRSEARPGPAVHRLGYLDSSRKHYVDFVPKDIVWLTNTLNAMKNLRRVKFGIMTWVNKYGYYFTSGTPYLSEGHMYHFTQWTRQSRVIAVGLKQRIDVYLQVELDIWADSQLQTSVRRAMKVLNLTPKDGVRFEVVEQKLAGRANHHGYWGRKASFRIERRFGALSGPSVTTASAEQ